MMKKVFLAVILSVTFVHFSSGQQANSLEEIYGEKYLQRIKEDHPKLFAKMEYDVHHGWEVIQASEKHIGHEQVEKIEIRDVESGFTVAELLYKKLISRHRSKKMTYLLADGENLLVLESQENQIKNFNKSLKK